MDEAKVVRILKALGGGSVPVCVDGGWGVDALLGEQTRHHADLDLTLAEADAAHATVILENLGFCVKPGGSAANFVLQHLGLGEIDMHCIQFDELGFGSFLLPDGRIWRLPPAAFAATGTISGLEVRCLSPDAQVQCHGQGYEPTESDLADMERLQEKFGVVLPVSLCRRSETRPIRAAQPAHAADGAPRRS